MVDGKEVVMQLKVGDRVITGKYTGTEVKIDGEGMYHRSSVRYSGSR